MDEEPEATEEILDAENVVNTEIDGVEIATNETAADTTTTGEETSENIEDIPEVPEA